MSASIHKYFKIVNMINEEINTQFISLDILIA
jgi:hypothetical protein